MFTYSPFGVLIPDHTQKMPHAESPKPQAEKLFVNDGQLAPEQIGTLKPTPIDTPLEEVRRRSVRAHAYGGFLNGMTV